jgi:hypothetical protein
MSQGKRLVLGDDFIDDAADAPPPQQQQQQPGQAGAASSSAAAAAAAAATGAGAAAGGSADAKSRAELERIAEAHRRSLVGISGDGRPLTVDDLATLSGVTMSKRHCFTAAEYESGANPQVFEGLTGFKFDAGTPVDPALLAAAIARSGSASSGSPSPNGGSSASLGTLAASASKPAADSVGKT